jgi:hypothetical protein
LPDGWIDRLFLRLHAMYGKAWLDLWAGLPAATVKAQWSASLSRCSSEQIRLALNALESSGKPFPPNLPEFYALCEEYRPRKAPTLYLAAPRTAPPENIFANLKRQLDEAKDGSA